MTKFQIGTFAAPTAPNEWDEATQALIDNAVNAETGEINREVSITVSVPAGVTKSGEDAMGAPDRVKFQRSARDKGYTARHRGTEGPDKDGNYALTFTLTPAQQARRGGKSVQEESAIIEDVATAE